MLISTKGRYVTRMLLDIAEHQGDGYVCMKGVADRQQISKKYLESFTSVLESNGILCIRRGSCGGYRLCRDPGDITLLEVLRLTEGSLRAVSCLEQDPNPCPRKGFCMTLPAWEGLDRLVTEYLEGITLKDLLDQAKPQPERPQDYPFRG